MQSSVMNEHIKMQTERMKSEINRQKTNRREGTESAVLGDQGERRKRKSSHSFSYTVSFLAIRFDALMLKTLENHRAVRLSTH